MIPKEIRRKHKLEKDTDLVLQDEGEMLILRKKEDVDRLLRDEFYPLLQASERSLRALWNNSEDDAWNEA